nr:hypothetical protein [Tanacetum cinerariifolium]
MLVRGQWDLCQPANYKAALLDLEFDKWLNAINVEMESMKDNEVWDLVDLPPNDKTVGSKWLFKKKTDMDGAVDDILIIGNNIPMLQDVKSYLGRCFVMKDLEPEYIAAYEASMEAVWFRKFISELDVFPIIEDPINMYCDNIRAITIAKESGITKGSRHFRVKVYYLCKVFEYGDVKLEKVHTDDNLGDLFTKALAFPKHSEHTKNI